MTSFRIAISPSERAGARFVSKVRRSFQQAMIEEGITQSEIARILGVHRSVINREIRGDKGMTLGRAGELAFALRRRADFGLPKRKIAEGSNIQPVAPLIEIKVISSSSSASGEVHVDVPQQNIIFITKAA